VESPNRDAVAECNIYVDRVKVAIFGLVKGTPRLAFGIVAYEPKEERNLPPLTPFPLRLT
jgi:hypothetical protein